MRYLLFLLLLISSVTYSQSNVDFRGDSARFYKNGGSMEVVIRNSTKDSTNGILVNTGNGVTSFLKLRVSNDSLFLGNTFISLIGSSGNDSAYINFDLPSGYVIVDGDTTDVNIRQYLQDSVIYNQFTSKESKSLWITRVKADSGFFAYLKLPNIEFGNPDSVIFKISGQLITVSAKNRGYYITGAGGVPIVNYQTAYWNGSAWVATNNFGIGPGALTNNTGASVFATGTNAGSSNTGSFGTFNGMSAGQQNTASSVTFTGYTTGQNNTGAFATGTGMQALLNNTGIYGTTNGARGGQHNIGGYFTGNGFANGQFNTGEGLSADGYAAGQYNTADSVTATGYQSLQYNNSPRRTAYGNNTGNVFITDISKTFASADISGATITITAHGFGTVGKKVNLRYTVNSGTTIGGLVTGNLYQFTIASANTLTLSTITNAGSGTFTLEKAVDRTNSTEIGNGANATKANQVMLGNSSVTEVKTAGVISAGASTYSSGGYKPLVRNTTSGNFEMIDQTEVYPMLDGDSLRLTDGSVTTSGVRVQSDTKIKLQTGSNKSIGTATLVAGTVTVSTTAVTSSSLIFVTVNTPGGTQGFLSVPSGSIVNGTSFVINSSSNTETSTVNWWIIN